MNDSKYVFELETRVLEQSAQKSTMPQVTAGP